MKEKTKGIIIGAVAATVLTGAVLSTAAEELYKTVQIAYNNIKICIDGTYIEPKDANGNKVEPFTMNGTTYLPVRAVAGAFGKDVDWDGETSTVYLGAKPGENIYSRQNPAPIGTTQTVDIDNIFEKYTASVVVKEVIRGDEANNILRETNSVWNGDPAEGKEYCLVKVSVTVYNVKDDAAVNLSSANFDFYSADYSQYSDNYLTVVPEPSFNGKVFSGGTVEGYICQQINKDDPTPTLVFGDDYDGKGGIWFSLTK